MVFVVRIIQELYCNLLVSMTSFVDCDSKVCINADRNLWQYILWAISVLITGKQFILPGTVRRLVHFLPSTCDNTNKSQELSALFFLPSNSYNNSKINPEPSIYIAIGHPDHMKYQWKPNHGISIEKYQYRVITVYLINLMLLKLLRYREFKSYMSLCDSHETEL